MQLHMFTNSVVKCLLYDATDDLRAKKELLTHQVQRVLGEGDKLPDQPTRKELEDRLQEIRSVLPADKDRIALVAGGATKIKGYVFEAPKLPEIRGASALLDWVNELGLRELWHDIVGKALGNTDAAEQCIVYASGGGFLAFAPAALADELVAAAERCYTKQTLTANSVFVAGTFSLLELRYGRLSIQDDKIPFWIDEFITQWSNPASQRILSSYYYGSDAEPPTERFYRRKTFGELVTLLATMANQRRDERASHGDTRSVPRYELIPWAEKCDSSDIRPAVWSGRVVDEDRQLSEASARKRYVGQTVKNDDPQATQWFRDAFPEWDIPDALSKNSWEHQWVEYLNKEGANTQYAKQLVDIGMQPDGAEPPKDVGWIGQASLPRRYIGVIYADGNNVGRLVATLKTPQQYAAVSHSLSTIAKTAVFQAIARYLAPTQIILTTQERRIRGTNNDTVWAHPFEILAIGGDDLFIIVPGDRALEIACAIAEYFEQEIAHKLDTIPELQHPENALSITSYPQRLHKSSATSLSQHNYTPWVGLSAGVIIAQENAPIFFLRDLVDELLKSAKKLAKQHTKLTDQDKKPKEPFYGGAIDFMVMKSITMVTDKIKSFRRQALGDDSNRRLTARPYTWHEFAGLLNTVRAIKKANVPRSQLYRLRHTLDAEPGSAITPSVMEYLYTRTRINSAYGEALLEHIERPWCWETAVSDRVAKLPPWMPLGKTGWETIWADMLELYEMVPAEEAQ